MSSRSFVLSLKRPQDALGVKRPFSASFFEGRYRLFTMILSACGCLLLGFSIISVNMSASKVYTIRSLERQAERLREQVSALEAQAALVQSYSSLQERVRDLGYVPVEEVRYIE